jgi:hypothetical protein
MKISTAIHFVLIVLSAQAVTAQETPSLTARRTAAGLEFSWPATQQRPDGSIARPHFELQRSLDMIHWQPIGERQRAAAAATGQSLSATLAFDAPQAFIRLLVVEPRDDNQLGFGGAEVFGYGDAFARELQRIGQITTDRFAAMFPSGADYLPGIRWNPTTARFWELFNADPAVVNAGKNSNEPGYRDDDFRLNAAELAVFTNQGFVVSERLGSHSFARSFYQLWHNDLPVFISTDAILQAWHKTYDSMLEEIEETYLFSGFEAMLDGMAAQLPAAWAESGNGALKDSLLDADYFLAVARSLLAGQPVPSRLNQEARVAVTLADVQAEQMKTVSSFLGDCRVMDFSQFKVRGHYEHSERLGRYFKCVMWLGRTDLAVAGGPFDRGCGPVMATPRETGTAIVLWHLLNRSGQFQAWVNFDRIIQAFVGWTDSLTFAQLGGVLSGAGIRSLADVPDLVTLERLQSDIVAGNLGVQNIRSDYFVQPLAGSTSYALPRAFTVFGQKFIPDSWAFSQTVFSSISWVENGATNLLPRRIPGALDAAFAILGNNQIVPDLVARINGTLQDSARPHTMKFRDGLPYQHNLAAARVVMDAQSPGAWESNIYLSWLAALRELSAPTTDAQYPEAMRTRAWAMKTLNTQLASWTQLRHDTILYAKRSYTDGGSCIYPAGFVEPRVAFWQRLRATANRTADLIAALPYQGTYLLGTDSIPLSTIQSNQVNHLRRFAGTLSLLQAMSEKELAQQPFNSEEEMFLRHTVEELDSGAAGYRPRPPAYDGWYFDLFYRAAHLANQGEAFFQQTYGADTFDAIVADVHTDVPCGDCRDRDPGSVLHEGVGRVNLLMIAVDNGPDRMVFAGPVLSHYEFEILGAPRRLNDSEWQATLSGTYPEDVPASRIEGLAPPEWTRSYLIPNP